MKNKTELYKIKPINQIEGYRILRRGDVIRTTDLQYVAKPSQQVTPELIEALALTGARWKGIKLGYTFPFEDYRINHHTNLYYRKVGAK